MFAQKAVFVLFRLLFIPVAMVFCYGVTVVYPKLFPAHEVSTKRTTSLPDLPPLPRLKSDLDRPVPKSHVVVGIEKAKLAIKEKAYGLAIHLFKVEMEKMSEKRYEKWQKRVDNIEELHRDSVAMEVARRFIRDKKYYGARMALDLVENIRNHKTEYMNMYKILDSHLIITDATEDYLRGDFKSVLGQLEYLESEDADLLRQRISKILESEQQAEIALDQQDYHQAKARYLEIQTILDDPTHGMHLKVQAKLEQISDSSWLAKAYIERGDQHLVKRDFEEAKRCYQKATDHDQNEAEAKLDYLQRLPQELLSNAKANEKSRPQMAYYAYKEALSLLGEPSMIKNVKFRMKAIANRLKRYDMHIDQTEQ